MDVLLLPPYGEAEGPFHLEMRFRSTWFPRSADIFPASQLEFLFAWIFSKPHSPHRWWRDKAFKTSLEKVPRFKSNQHDTMRRDRRGKAVFESP